MLTQRIVKQNKSIILNKGIQYKERPYAFARGFQKKGFVNEMVIQAINEIKGEENGRNSKNEVSSEDLIEEFIEGLLRDPLIFTPEIGRNKYPKVTVEENESIIIQASTESYTLNMHTVEYIDYGHGGVPMRKLVVSPDLPIGRTQVGDQTRTFPWELVAIGDHAKASQNNEELVATHKLIDVRYLYPEEGEDASKAKAREKMDKERLGLVFQLEEVEKVGGEHKTILFNEEELTTQFVICNADYLLSQEAVKSAILDKKGKAYLARDVYVMREKKDKMYYDKPPLAHAR